MNKPKNKGIENALLAAVGNEDSKEFINILCSVLSLSKDGDSCKLYSKCVDGSRQLIFSGSEEDLKNFTRAAEFFAKTLRQLF